MDLSDNVTIIAFDQVFTLPRSHLKESEVLSIGLSGKFREKNEIILDLSPDVHPAFLIVYRYLLDPNKSLRVMSLRLLGSTLSLAEYLGMPRLTHILIQTLSLDQYRKDDSFFSLISEFASLDGISEIGREYIRTKGNYWNNLNLKVQSALESSFNQDLLDSFVSPIGLHFIRPSSDQRKILSMMPSGWAKICQKNNRPDIVEDISTIPQIIGRHKNIIRIEDDQGRGHYATGPGGKQISLFNLNGQDVPCCQGGKTVPLLDSRWKSLQACMTSQGWVALIDPNFKVDLDNEYNTKVARRPKIIPKGITTGDFVMIWNPIVLPDLRMIIDADYVMA